MAAAAELRTFNLVAADFCGRERARSAFLEKFLDRQSDVADNLPQQRRCKVTAFVHRNGSAASVGMAILDVRTALAHGVETQPFEQPADLGGFEDGHGTHNQAKAML
jgi:hypothetical protein